jgi:hypothetical protein
MAEDHKKEIHIEDGNVKCIVQIGCFAQLFQNFSPDGIALVLQRSVDAAICLIAGNAAQMTGQTVHIADDLSVEGAFDQLCCEGVIDVTLRFIHGDALNVAFAPRSGKNWLFHGDLRLA